MRETSFFCKPTKGERVETQLQLSPSHTAAIYGVVTAPDGSPVTAALVLLFRVEEDPPGLIPQAQSTTDTDGHFAFGGLEGDVLYRVKVFPQGGRVRVLEACPPRE